MDMNDIANFEYNFDWEKYIIYDISNEKNSYKFKYISNDDAESCKTIVIKKLKEENIYKYDPEIEIVDKNLNGYFIIYVSFEKEIEHSNQAPKGRTYTLFNHRIVKEEKSRE